MKFDQLESKTPSVGSASTCFLVNQFATPGLGSLMAGRVAAGIGQLTLALTGFVMVVLWFVHVMREEYAVANGASEVHMRHWIGITGGSLFATAWLWALITSIGVIRKANRAAKQQLTT